VKVGGHEFLEFDDYSYVMVNSHVQQGLTLDGLRWAFSTFARGNWHPLTWLSHMLDVSLFGMNAGYHHMVNVLFHCLSTALLFLLFSAMTGKLWRSAFIAALFGVHPLHVESVAWVAERKDVLSGFFFMLTLLAYAGYARRACLRRYLLVVLFFALGLMAKPMLVTLPFVLLVLDVWPLGRTSIAGPADGRAGSPLAWRRLLLEKVPLAGLSILSSIVTYAAQQEGSAVATFENLPFTTRAANAVVSYVVYLEKMFWPSSLAVYYPHPGDAIRWWQIAGAALLILFVSYIVLKQLRHRPFLAVGWSWYIVMLLPVIGLIQVGGQAMADRYTYLPLIGPFVMVTYLAVEAVPGIWRFRIVALRAAATAVLAILCYLSFVQAGYWSNGVTLFTHALAVTSRNALAETSLGCALNHQGRNEEAIAHFQSALQIKPDDPQTHRDFGLTLASSGRLDEAIAQFREALELNPDDKLTLSFLEFYSSRREGEVNPGGQSKFLP
jgi:tetratricopeptide (TPR) repeat protein